MLIYYREGSLSSFEKDSFDCFEERIQIQNDSSRRALLLLSKQEYRESLLPILCSFVPRHLLNLIKNENNQVRIVNEVLFITFKMQ
jgi:hypothetical protein